MKQDKLSKFHQLVRLREERALVRLHAAKRNVEELKAKVSSAEQELEEMKIQGEVVVDEFLKGNEINEGSYSSRLNKLRALQARVGHEIQLVREFILETKRQIVRGENAVAHIMNEYREKSKRTSKIDTLHGEVCRENLIEKSNMQEAEIMDSTSVSPSKITV